MLYVCEDMFTYKHTCFIFQLISSIPLQPFHFNLILRVFVDIVFAVVIIIIIAHQICHFCNYDTVSRREIGHIQLSMRLRFSKSAHAHLQYLRRIQLDLQFFRLKFESKNNTEYDSFKPWYMRVCACMCWIIVCRYGLLPAVSWEIDFRKFAFFYLSDGLNDIYHTFYAYLVFSKTIAIHRICQC